MAETSRRQVMLILVAIFIVSCDGIVEGSRSLSDLEIERHFKRINKPAVKTIKNEDGDIIDCVDIYRQNAFDHPLLKNHEIQMRPSGYPMKMEREVMSAPQLQLQRQKSRSCPEGTVPVLRALSLESLRKINLKSDLGHESAAIQARGDYYGAKAEINVWNPHSEPNEFTASKISLNSGDDRVANNIQAGWIVHPGLWGDNKTRLFIYWSTDTSTKSETGCYNTICPGFVQVSNKIFPGNVITPISSYNGSQYGIQLMVFKDKKTGDWWLVYGADERVGYWPSSLFKNTFDHTSLTEWGGEVLNTETGEAHTTTQMGSGHFPPEGFGKSSHFRNILVVDSNNNYRVPDAVTTSIDKPQCYDLIYNQGKMDKDMGPFFYYGGPGRGPNCP